MAPPRSSAGVHGFELDRAGGFEEIIQGGSVVGIAGFGSLLSERSANSTFKDVTRFRQGKLRGYRRVFAHVGPNFITLGISKPPNKVASLSVEKASEDSEIVVSLFDMAARDIPAFIEREAEYRFFAVQPVELDGTVSDQWHIICHASTDKAFLTNYGQERFNAIYGSLGIRKIWDDGILPCPLYLRHCVLAAENLSPAAHASFLDGKPSLPFPAVRVGVLSFPPIATPDTHVSSVKGTYLADRKTTIRAYLEQNPTLLSDIDVPQELAERYGG